MSTRRASFLGLISAFVTGVALGSQAIPNWPAPATWSPPGARGVTALSEAPPLPFVAVTPCRLADTRGNGFTGQFGPPSLVANATRSFTVTGQCGIPAVAAGVSFNFTALNVSAPGDLRVFPAGGSVPLVSTLNYNANTPDIANAAVVELGGGAITVQADAVSIDLIIDVNGYYSYATSTPQYLSLAYPIQSIIYTANGDAVIGINNATTGQNYGVFGRTSSAGANSAGVYGNDRGTGTLPLSYVPAGVLGFSSTLSPGTGVQGIAYYQGVAGSLLNNVGSEIAYGILGFQSGASYAVYAGGDFGGSGAKYFVEPHPTDASKVIRYVSLEGPEAGTYFRGRGRFQNGLATIEVPEDFRMVTDPEGLSIQVTPIGEFASVAVVRLDLEEILVKGSRNVEFFYTVNGVRKTHRDLKPIGPGSEFMPRSADARMPLYLTEGQKALLVSNGTYNADGTVNMETAERLGWTKIWAEGEAQAKAAAASNAVAHAATLGERK